MSTRHEPLAVGSTFGPYRLDRLIGRGGMGEVYQAYDTVKDRTVAIKVLPERLADDPVYRQRFQRESHAAARLREAHVIPIHDYGEIDGRLFIDMRLVDGDSLRSLLHRAGPGSPSRAVGVITQVASALDAAHAEGLLHRDIKPDNILLTHDGFTYLVDFGIAQSSTDASLTSTGAAVGSYRYMAPERFAATALTPAADVYGLACVLFECLTGTRPYSGTTDAEVMRAHLFDPIPRPSMVRSTVPGTFDSVIARGMAKNPEERYSTAGELAEAAAQALADTGPWSVVTQEQSTGSPGARPANESGRPTGPPGSGRDAGFDSGSGRSASKGDRSVAEPTLPGTNSWWQSGETPRPGRGTNPVRAESDPLRPTTGESPGGRSTGPTANLNPVAKKQDSTPSSTGTASTGTGPTESSRERRTEDPHPRRGRRPLALLGVIVLLAAALGFAGWAWTQQVRDGTAVPDASAPRAADIELLSLVQPSGYKRANCNRLAGDAVTVSVLSCAANPAASAPLAQFRKFADADALREFYTGTVLSTFRTDGCVGSASGRDAASLVDGSEVGRKTCYDDLTVSPTDPKPVLVLTNSATFALAIYIWDSAAQKPLRDYAAKNSDGWQFSAPNKARDPDFFTEPDRALLTHLGDSYTYRNCEHFDLPAGALADATVGCASGLDSPAVTFFGFPEQQLATITYQAQLSQSGGHICGSGGGTDDVWRKDSGPVGRFFCFDNAGLEPARPCLFGIHDQYRSTFMICALPPEHPEQGPKTEQELLAWFQRNFG